jgi:hypothetical protein
MLTAGQTTQRLKVRPDEIGAWSERDEMIGVEAGYSRKRHQWRVTRFFFHRGGELK